MPNDTLIPNNTTGPSFSFHAGRKGQPKLSLGTAKLGPLHGFWQRPQPCAPHHSHPQDPERHPEKWPKKCFSRAAPLPSETPLWKEQTFCTQARRISRRGDKINPSSSPQFPRGASVHLGPGGISQLAINKEHALG